MTVIIPPFQTSFLTEYSIIVKATIWNSPANSQAKAQIKIIKSNI